MNDKRGTETGGGRAPSLFRMRRMSLLAPPKSKPPPPPPKAKAEGADQRVRPSSPLNFASWGCRCRRGGKQSEKKVKRDYCRGCRRSEGGGLAGREGCAQQCPSLPRRTQTCPSAQGGAGGFSWRPDEAAAESIAASLLRASRALYTHMNATP